MKWRPFQPDLGSACWHFLTLIWKKKNQTPQPLVVHFHSAASLCWCVRSDGEHDAQLFMNMHVRNEREQKSAPYLRILMQPFPLVRKNMSLSLFHEISFTSNLNCSSALERCVLASMKVTTSSLFPTAMVWPSGLQQMLMFSPLDKDSVLMTQWWARFKEGSWLLYGWAFWMTDTKVPAIIPADFPQTVRLLYLWITRRFFVFI